jgi:hypothetical protein
MFNHNQTNFVELCIQGKCSLNEIDNYIDQWHDSDTTLQIYDYLGMTQREYRLWVSMPNSLWLIIAAKKQQCSIDEMLLTIQQNSPITIGADSTGYIRR